MPRPHRTPMNRKILVLVLALGAIGIAALFLTRQRAGSIVGRWHLVGGTEQMVFTGNGDMEVAEVGGSGSAPGSYTFVDSQHLRVEFALGSPRLVWFSPSTGDMTWTNNRGMVLRYTNEPGSFVKVRASRALGL